MTNREIIISEMVVNNITETLHTYAKWLSLGYRVKRGEHALVTTCLWKPVYNKKTDETKLRLCKAFLFGESQVEKVV